MTHKGVREAKRRVAAIEGASRLDLAGLDLSDSDLRTLGPAIGNLSTLTGLWLDDNQLTVVPEAIGNLSSLTEVDLSSNQLAVVPEAIGDLTALTRLDLSSNELTSLVNQSAGSYDMTGAQAA